MSFMEHARHFVHAHRVPVLTALVLALFLVLFLFLMCISPRELDEVSTLIEPVPIDPLEFLLPPQAELLPQTLPVLEQDPQALATEAWTPVDDMLRSRIDEEARELVNQLLERAP